MNKEQVSVRDERGASMLEYAMLAALIAVVCLTAISTLGTEANKAFSKVASGITSANANS